jgi:CRISPR-associated helicase Cas3/CRISPR-associated endonuclease Cas3-HD
MTKDICYLAHSANGDGKGIAEPLCQHLRAVAQRAAEFARAFGAEPQASAAGLVHDLGKYADQFLRRLSDPREPGRDHWTAGAALLLAKQPRLGLFPALAIAGHHTGLDRLGKAADLARDIAGDLRNHPDRFTTNNLKLLQTRLTADGLSVPRIEQGLECLGPFAADMLDVRMFFSALVDADFLETEAHFAGDAQTPRRPRPDGPLIDLPRAIASLDDHLASVRRRFAGAPMAAARESLLSTCLTAAENPRGLYCISAPTGAGKTLAVLAFALYHARGHQLRRIVLVMPFLNIIEQTARIYRDIFAVERGFDPRVVLEDHSLADRRGRGTTPGEDGTQAFSRLLAENWDAPVILTTTVQLLESLMADRPSRCRKLHRLAHSVILFDEVQTLPLPLAVATLSTLSRLADPAGPYGSTVVFATATQPAFDTLHEKVAREFAASGWEPVEIVSAAGPLYAVAGDRVRVAWRHRQPIELDDLADELADHPRVLCIVNLKRHAVRLASRLREKNVKGLAHLSTNMCPRHREEVLRKVRRRLDEGRPVRLVATQCVEAGVDLDFPLVYRALAPLEAIAQAAGRCNRHGSGPQGQVVVFLPRDERGLYPPGYGQAVDATAAFLELLSTEGDLDSLDVLNHPDRLRAYFRQLYGLTGRSSSEMPDEKELLLAIRAGDFAEVARLYKLISHDSIQVLVPHDREELDRLQAEIDGREPMTSAQIRDWLRRAGPHAVGMIRPGAEAEIWNGLEPIAFGRREVDQQNTDWFSAGPALGYDPLVGLSPKSEALWIA